MHNDNGRRSSALMGLAQLLPQHTELIEASAISSDIARARGYRSVIEPGELRALGFRPAQARTPALLVPIYGPRGVEPVLYQTRPDEPRKRDGKPVKYETPANAGMRLDVPPTIRARIGDPREALWITEGVRKADAAVSAGACCVAVIGVWNWRGRNDAGGKTALADWEDIALNGRTVLLAFDSDAMEKKQVHGALGRLKSFLTRRGAHVLIAYLPAGADAKTGLDDYLADGGTLEELIEHASPELRPLAGDENGNGPTQATQLVQLAEDAGIELFHTPGGEPFGTVPVDAHRKTLALSRGATGMKRWLARRYHDSGKGAAGAQVVQDALNVLEAKAMFDGPELPIFTRVAARDDTVYVDLGDTSWHAVEIHATGWRVVADPPVKFRRARGVLALPYPIAGGSIDELRPFVNVADEDGWALLLGWLVGALAPSGPYPLLSLHGEQGSAKSTTARILRALIDPNSAALRAEPREVRELMISATNGWCLALDNLSRVPAWLSDALCRLSTGGGFAARELHTDSDEVIFDAQRPVLLTGIEELATRSDLLDRALLLELPRIPAEKVSTERALWRAFELARPRILGALLDGAAAALAGRGRVELAQLPRMADFAEWVVAAEPALGLPEGRFLKAYTGNRSEANDIALEASPIGEPLRELVGQGSFEGTMSDLLARLEELASELVTRQRGWPKSARALSGHLRRLAPNLRTAGIEIEHDKKGRGRERRAIVRLKASPGLCDPTYPSDPNTPNPQQRKAIPGVANGYGGGANGELGELGSQPPPISPSGVANTGGGVAAGSQTPRSEWPVNTAMGHVGARGVANSGPPHQRGQDASTDSAGREP
jgi:Domain of unknown function (DUF3854)